MINIDKRATELLIENGELVADTLRNLADNEIDSDYFAICHTNENGTEIECELAITDYARQAAGTVDELVKALEAKDRRTAEQVDIIAKQEKWIKNVEATMIAATDRAEAAEKRIVEQNVIAFNPAFLDVIAERQRQRAIEGWTSEHDDAYQNSELADAAACYAINAHNQGFSTPANWPWAPEWWKQSGARRDLVKAGALILSEIERIDRAAAAGKGE